jgi:hypothetical protein
VRENQQKEAEAEARLLEQLEEAKRRSEIGERAPYFPARLYRKSGLGFDVD